MSTTMIGNHHRRFVTPVGVGPPNKRKAWDHLDGPKPSPFKKPTLPSNLRPGPTTQTQNNKPSHPEPAQNNQLLAGYLAHEFLTKGTLVGEPWDPARAEAVPVSADSRREEAVDERSRAKPSKEKYERYVEVADLLKTDKVQLSGVVNPTQLARFLQM